MTSKRDRFFALFFAVLFIVTAIGFTIVVIVSNISNRNKGSSTSTTTASTKKLQGTNLNNFTPISSIPTLKVEDLTAGTGATVQAGDTVTVDYTGAVAATGIVFQSSLDTGQPVSFSLSQVIKGWTDGIPGMKVGGVRRLLIPAADAYGANPPAGSGIPANADLVFDVTLHKIGQ